MDKSNDQRSDVNTLNMGRTVLNGDGNEGQECSSRHMRGKENAQGQVQAADRPDAGSGRPMPWWAGEQNARLLLFLA